MKASDTHDIRYSRAIAILREQRRNLGMTQADLAQKLGTRQQFISKYESGERRLDIIEYLDVVAALGLPLDQTIDLIL